MTTAEGRPTPAASQHAGDLDFYFDPACPWTWMTSRWLIDAAARRGLAVSWRPLSLLVLSDGRPDDEHAETARVAARAHRMFAALTDAGRDDLVPALYTEIGIRHHDRGDDLTVDLVRSAVEQVGAGPWADALDDDGWDGAVERSTKEALQLAGPDVGSPVLAHGTPRVGIFGPIVNPGPRGSRPAGCWMWCSRRRTSRDSSSSSAAAPRDRCYRRRPRADPPGPTGSTSPVGRATIVRAACRIARAPSSTGCRAMVARRRRR